MKTYYRIGLAHIGEARKETSYTRNINYTLLLHCVYM
jgi:hypothetical protein